MSFIHSAIEARRAITRHRFSTLAGVLSLALAVGPNAAILGLIVTLWSPPVLVSAPEELVQVIRTRQRPTRARTMFDGVFRHQYESIQAATLFEAVTAEALVEGLAGDFRPRIVSEDGRRLTALPVAANYFSTLGVAVRGRDFSPHDDMSGAPLVAIVSHDLWRRYFGRQPALGRNLPLEGQSIRVIGIAEPGFRGYALGDQVDLWIPLRASADFITVPREFIDRGYLRVIGRLSPALRVDVADHRLGEVLGPDYNVVRLMEKTDPLGQPGEHRTPRLLQTIGTLGGIVLLLSLANFVGIIAVRVYDRWYSLGIRMALGASRSRILLPLSIEITLSALAATALGLVLARLTLQSFGDVVLTHGLPVERIYAVVHGRGVVIASCIAILLSLTSICALFLILGNRTTPSGFVRLSSAGASRRTRLHGLLLVGHTSGAMCLAITAMLFVRETAAAFSYDFGFPHGRIIELGVQPNLNQYAIDGEASTPMSVADRRAADFGRLLADLVTNIGAESASYGALPLTADGARPGLSPVLLRDVTTGRTAQAFVVRRIGSGYAGTLSLKLLAGRYLQPTDVVALDAKPAIVSEAFARELGSVPGAVGSSLETPGLERFEIVGIVSDLVRGGPREPSTKLVYVASPFPSEGFAGSLTAVVRFRHSAQSRLADVTQAIETVFPDPAQLSLRTGTEALKRQFDRERLAMSALAWFTGATVVMAALGVYAVVTFAITSRRRELGIRLALGQTENSLIRLTMASALLPVVTGMLVGIGAATLLTASTRDQLSLVGNFDATSYISATVVVAFAAAAAAAVAANRVRAIAVAQVLRLE